MDGTMQAMLAKLDDLIEAHHVLPSGRNTLSPATKKVSLAWLLVPLSIAPKSSFTIMYLIDIAKKVRLFLTMDVVIENRQNSLSLKENIYVEIVESFVAEDGRKWLSQSSYHYSYLHQVKTQGLSANQIIEYGQLLHYSEIVAILLNALFP